ncbi:MAG: hypothetical protein ACFFD1_03290 [Candidatus Thorarchaeota archaeon]
MSQFTGTSTSLFTTDRAFIEEKTPFSIPSIDLIRSILRTRELAESFRKKDKWQLYSILMMTLFDVTCQFDDLSHSLDLAQDFAKKTKERYPDQTLNFINYAVEVYRDASKKRSQTIATRLAFSRLKMQAATIRLEEKKDINLADVRAELYHTIPVIQELNFIVVLIKTENYLKATLFLTDLSSLFLGDRMDSRLTLPFYELACLAYLGQKQYAKALEALDQGYKMVQKLPKSSFPNFAMK